jgi:zinc protease
VLSVSSVVDINHIARKIRRGRCRQGVTLLPIFEPAIKQGNYFMLPDSLSPLTRTFDRATSETNAAATVFDVPSLRILVQNAIANADLSQARVAQALDLPQCVTLSNGMTLYLQRRKDNVQQSFAYLRLVVRTGFLSEDSAQAEQQIAHLVEHGLLQGTESFSAEEIKKLREEVNCLFDSNARAHTAPHETVYKLNDIPLEENGSFDKYLKLIFEFACKATFPPEALLKERSIVENELIKYSIGADWERAKFVYNHLRAGSGEAEHLTDGFDPKIRICEGKELHQHLMNFYKKWYQPHNMALVAVGDFGDRTAEVFQSIEELFKKIPTAKEQGLEEHRLKKAYPVPPKDKILYACFTHSQLSRSSIEIHIPVADEKKRSHNGQERDRFIFRERIYHLCLEILKSRLHPVLSSSDNSFTGYSLISHSPERDGKFTNFNIWSVTANQGKLAEAFKAFTSHIFTLYKKGVTKSELMAAKTLIYSREYCYRAFKNQDLVDEYVKAFSNESVPAQDAACFLNYMYALKKISLADVEEVIRDKWNLFTPEVQKNISILGFYPENAQPKSLMADVKKIFEKIPVEEPFQDVIQLRNDLEWLPKRPPVCAPLTTQYIEQIDCRKLQFKNGIRVFLKSADKSQPTTSLKIIIPHGFKNTQSRSDSVALRMGFTILNNLGLADRTKHDITASLREMPLSGSQIQAKATLTHCELQLGCKSIEALELALQLLHSRLNDLQPIYSDEFKNLYLIIIKNSVDHYKRLSNTENEIFLTELKNLLFGEHPVLKSCESEDFDSITLEQCQEAIKTCFQSLSRSSFVICGNFECDDVIPLVNSYVGALPTSPTEDQENRYPSLPFPTENKEKTLYSKAAKDSSKTSLVIPLPRISNEKERYLLERSAIVLSQYLHDTVESKEQLLYSVNCGLFTPDPSLNPPALSCSFLNISFVSSFSLHDKIHERMLELLTNTSEQPSEKFLECSDIIKKGKKKDFELNSHSIDRWFLKLCDYLQRGSSPAFIAEEENWESALTTDELYRILREKIFTNPTLIKLTMHPQQ